MSKRAFLSELPPEQLAGKADVLSKQLRGDGTFPNGKLPLLLYRKAVLMPEHDPAVAFERLFGVNGWRGGWRNGIYSFHHYHSTAHEVLGVYRGSAKVQSGGEHGMIQEVHPGDVILIPAGVAHKNLGSTADFGVVGAYPEGQEWDMNYGNSGERPQADRNIAQVPLPNADPVFGHGGPLMEHWAAH